jgi:hypothetical protein
VLLLEVLDAGQVAAVVVGPDQQLLLLDPRLLVGDVPAVGKRRFRKFRSRGR